MKRAAKTSVLSALVLVASLGLWSRASTACTLGSNCVLTGGTPPDAGPAPGERFTNLSAAGLFVASTTDFNLPGPMPLVLTRTYRTRDVTAGVWNVRPFGVGVNFNYSIFLYSFSERASGTSYNDAQVILPDGGRVYCNRTSSCSQQGCTDYTDAVFTCTANPGPFYGATISYNSGTTGFDLSLKDGTVYSFGHGAPLQKIHDRYQNSITITSSGGQISQILSSNGRYLNFTYSGGVVTKVADNTGRSVTYSYDSNNRLTSFTDANGNSTGQCPNTTASFTYVNTTTQLGDLACAADALGNQGNATYDPSLRLKTLSGALGSYSYAYATSGAAITECDVTDPRKHLRKLVYNTVSFPGYQSGGYVTSDTRAADDSSVTEVFNYTRDSHNLITAVTDPLGRQTQYVYDNGNDTLANITSVTYLPPATPVPTPTPVTYSYGYGAFSQLQSVTDPLNDTWSAYIDPGTGNATSVTDPLGNKTTATYDPNTGQLTSVTDPLGNKTSYTYNGGDLASIQDPLGNVSNLTADAAGRLTSFRDPTRETTSFSYDNENRVTQVTDPNLHNTNYTYDVIGDLTNVKDANGHSSTFKYTFGMGQVSSCDAVNNCAQYNYDAMGNLSSFQDARGLVTAYTYDSLNRLQKAVYNNTNVSGYAQTSITYTYDLGNRLMTAADTNGSGTITQGHDFLDNLTSETTLQGLTTTPQQTVTYQYDLASRRAWMRPASQAQVNYSYDNDDRLTGITQGSSGVILGYDAASRRTCLTLPNAVIVGYGYYNDSRVKSLTAGTGGSCLNPPSNLGNLAYSYDAAGRVVQVGGISATVNIPATATATYLNNNQLNTWKGNSASGDANGNLTADRVGHTYYWNERNHLQTVTLSSGGGYLMEYDAFGRRWNLCQGCLSSGTSTPFVYDGLNPVQGNGASMLTGLGLDEYFTRTDSSGTTVDFLRDGLGSTIALTNSSGSSVTQYSYEPFGWPTASGTTNSNPFQFTGREYDSVVVGLYYLRGRYYSTRLQRFVSKDPIGLSGGDANLYRYVGNDPADFTDPLGLSPAASGAASGFGLSGCDNCLFYLQLDLPLDFSFLVGGVQAALNGGTPSGGFQRPVVDQGLPGAANAQQSAQARGTGMQPNGTSTPPGVGISPGTRPATPQPGGGNPVQCRQEFNQCVRSAGASNFQCGKRVFEGTAALATGCVPLCVPTGPGFGECLAACTGGALSGGGTGILACRSIQLGHVALCASQYLQCTQGR